MIVVDTSIAVAIVLDECDAEVLRARLADVDAALPTSCYLEAVVVLLGRIPHAREQLEGLLQTYDVSILPSDARQARLAADAFERYGRGTGHPAGLNFGDCLAYAAARAKDAPLLFKGEDFRHTDVRAAA